MVMAGVIFAGDVSPEESRANPPGNRLTSPTLPTGCSSKAKSAEPSSQFKKSADARRMAWFGAPGTLSEENPFKGFPSKSIRKDQSGVSVRKRLILLMVPVGLK